MYTFKAEGVHAVDLGRETVEAFKVITSTPSNNDGRATDTAATMIITGKIRSADESSIVDDTLKLAQWATEQDDGKAYTSSTATSIVSGQTLRNTNFPNAFVVEYTEEFNVEKGIGTFNLKLRQKKDLLEGVVSTGGYTGN